MSIKNVTIFGNFFTADNKPLANNNVDVYQLTNLFNTTVLTSFKTDDKGSYKFTYQMIGVKDFLVLLVPNRGGGEPLFRKFIVITESNPNVKINSPALQQKKKRSINRQSRFTYSHIDELAKKSWGPDWEIKMMEVIPNKTTERIQDAYREEPIPDNEQEKLAFLFNSLFWNPPKRHESGRKIRFSVSSEGMDKHTKRLIPSAIIDLKKIKGLFYLSKVSIRFQNEEWKKCLPEDPDFKRFLYLANSAAVIKGLSSKLIGLRFVLPSLYAQAFLSTISEHNPLRTLLGAHLTESLLLDDHLGLPIQKPLLDVAKCSDMNPAEMVQLLHEQLVLPPFELPAEPIVQDNYAKAFIFFRENVIKPTIADFFEYHRYQFEATRDRPENKNWSEIYALSQTFAQLHPLNSSYLTGWWKPFISNPKSPQKGEIQKLKEWCENAMLLTTLLPYVIQRNMNFLTDLRFATLNPVNQALKEDNTTFDEFGGTTPDDAAKQLYKAGSFQQKGGIPLDQYPGKHESFNKYLNEHAEELRGFKLNPKKLFVPTSGS